jgi:hypothetical protein
LLTKCKVHNNYVIEWELNGPLKPVLNKLELLSIVFDEVKCKDEFGLMIKLAGSNYDVLWVKASFFYQDIKKMYTDYIQDVYEITGAVFKHESDADKFKSILEKRYVWHRLQN